MEKTVLKATRSDGQRSRNAILDAAARLATVEGLDGLSIGHLADHIGMSKSGLYAHFASKQDLQLATIDTALDIFQREVIDPAVKVADPRAQLEALCDYFLDHLERRVFPGGCFFVAVAAEFDTHPGAVKERIAAIQNAWLQRFESLIVQSQGNGEIRADEDAKQLCFELDAYLLMANMSFVLHNDARALERASTAFRARLDRASTALAR
jgi:AcrR family transcriptional regulator